MELCEACGGSGRVMERHQVTQDMATDAGDPNLAGQPVEWEEQCSYCCGTGYCLDGATDKEG